MIDEPVIYANAKATNINIDLGMFVLADNLSNPTRHFHRIKAAASLCLGDAMSAPCDRSTASPFDGGINTNDERGIWLDFFLSCSHHQIRGIEVRRHESFFRRQRILTFEEILATQFGNLATAAADPLSIDAMQLCTLFLLRCHCWGSLFRYSQCRTIAFVLARIANSLVMGSRPPQGSDAHRRERLQ